jgi:putative membrane protein insertion efficiency factor
VKLLLAIYKRLLAPLASALLRSIGVETQCKFHPTCSEYAAQAIAAHGVVHGTLLAGSRLLRCHPFSAGGLDPVPFSSSHSHSVR